MNLAVTGKHHEMRNFIFYISSLLMMVLISTVAKGQAGVIYRIQDMSFGAFYVGNSGGSLSVSNTGTLTRSGGVIPLSSGQAYFPALFDIEAEANTKISFLKGPDAMLRGSNGGSITLKAADPEIISRTNSQNTSPSNPHRKLRLSRVAVGGTLNLQSAASSPGGRYSGNFSVIIFYE